MTPIDDRKRIIHFLYRMVKEYRLQEKAWDATSTHLSAFPRGAYVGLEKAIKEITLRRETEEYNIMTPARRAKQLGAKNLDTVAKAWGCSPQNLSYMFHNQPEKFEIIVLGSVARETHEFATTGIPCQSCGEFLMNYEADYLSGFCEICHNEHKGSEDD